MSDIMARALLDLPSPRSLGMLGLIVERKSGVLTTEGVLGSNRGLLQARDLEDLVADNQALEIDPLPVEPVSEGSLAALWVGDEFAAEAQRCQLLLPPLPKQSRGWNETGTFWIAPARHVWRVIDSWLVQAFRQVIAARSKQLAMLMNWALPEREETRAALWLTANGKEERDRDLRWWARLERDHGNGDVTPESLEARYKHLTNVAKPPAPKVLGFCAPAKGGDNEVAKWVAGHCGTPGLSFGKWLGARQESSGQPADRRSLQRAGQQIIDKWGGLRFCLEVFGAMQTPLPDSVFVIDGIRHVEVLESLQHLVGIDRFIFSFVNRPKSSRRELLIKQEGIEPGMVDEVMNDRTEEEMPLLRDRAKFRLDGAKSAEKEGGRLLSLA